MIKITKLVRRSVFMCILFLMANCTTNDDIDNHKIEASKQAKIWFDKNKTNYSAIILNYIKDLDWENAIVSDGNIGEVVEVPFTLKSNLSASNIAKTLYNDHHRLMFVKDGESNYKISYVQIFTNTKDDEIQNESFNYYDIKNDFNGKIFVQDFSNGIGKKIEFENGMKKEPSFTSKVSAYSDMEVQCVWFGYWFEDGHFEPIELLYCSTGGGEDGGTPEPVYGGGGSGSGGGNNNPLKYKIIDKLTGKEKCLNSLLSANGNSFVEKLLANFSGVSEFNITLISQNVVLNPLNNEVNGITHFISNNKNIDIILSNSRIEAAGALEGARIILHEYLHADMFRKLNTKNKNDVDASNFKQVFETYENNYHTAMANVYISSMATALKNFHKDVLTEDYNKYINHYGHEPTDEFYEAMSWGGLRDDDVSAWTSLSAEKKASINALAQRVKMLSKPAPCP